MEHTEQTRNDIIPYTFTAWRELRDGETLSLGNTDLATIASLTNNIKGILQTRETIPMSIQDGSLKFVFMLPAAVAALFVGRMNAYNSGQRGTDTIPRSVLSSLDALKRQADKSNISFTFSGEGRVVLRHEATRASNRERGAALTQETELIGFVTDAGGAGTPNIHLTNSRGTYLISASREQLADLDSNILFHYVRLAVLYKYDPVTNERKNYSLKHFISAEPVDETALNQAIAAATKAWADVTDPSEWLAELREEHHVSS